PRFSPPHAPRPAGPRPRASLRGRAWAGSGSMRRRAARRGAECAWRTPCERGRGDRISFPFDLHDGQLHLAGRPAHPHGVALALSQERPPERRLVADPAGTKVFRQLVAPDDLVRRLLAVLVLHGDGGAEEG